MGLQVIGHRRLASSATSTLKIGTLIRTLSAHLSSYLAPGDSYAYFRPSGYVSRIRAKIGRSRGGFRLSGGFQAPRVGLNVC